MRVLFVDDERSAHVNFRHDTEDNPLIGHVEYCYDYESAMSYAEHNPIDCAFLDVSLSGRDGITLARDLRNIYPHVELAFITGYDEYARDAYKVGGRAYLSKPYSKEDLGRVLVLMDKLVHPPKEMVEEKMDPKVHIFVKTFDSFDLLVDKKPVYFKNAKAKEMLAYLVHQMGGSVSNAQVFFALWERQEYTRTTSTYVRRTLRALKEELENLGISELLISHRNSLSINVETFTCDAYELLRGSGEATRTYNGQYMKQYSWSEETVPLLDRVAETINPSRI